MPFVLQQWVMAEGRKGQIIIRNATLGLYIQNQKENIGSWTIWQYENIKTKYDILEHTQCPRHVDKHNVINTPFFYFWWDVE